VFDESADLAAEMVTRLFFIVWLSLGIWNLSANGCGYGFRRLNGARKIRFIVQSISRQELFNYHGLLGKKRQKNETKTNRCIIIRDSFRALPNQLLSLHRDSVDFNLAE